jgi:hypothetical protein
MFPQVLQKLFVSVLTAERNLYHVKVRIIYVLADTTFNYFFSLQLSIESQMKRLMYRHYH